MICKKHFWLAALAGVSMILTACQGKQATPGGDPSSSGGDTGSVTSDTTPSSSDSSTDEKTISQIIVKEGTVPTNFVVGDTFSVTGGKLQIRYSDSTREEIDMTLAMIENAPDMTQAHENYEVHVLYEGARTNYYINVIAQDNRQTVSIGVSYEYNDGPVTDMVDNLSFYVGKPYKFHYGCYPSEAYDTIGCKYYQVGDETPIEKPEEIGNYIYRVYVAEGDDTYKPVSVEYHYSIINVVTQNVLVNSTNGPTLSDSASTVSDEVQGITFNYKNAKSASGALATLVKQCAADARPEVNDNYIEIASAISLAGPLTVEFTGLDNFIYVYGSYDLEHYFLVDTLTRAKNSTSRVNDYCFFRLVAAPLGHSEVTIDSISFTHEVDGVSSATVARAEKGDRFNHVSSSENNAYFHRRTEEVFDNNYSNKSIGIRLKECSVRVDLGTSLSEEEVKYYQVSFKVCPTENSVFHYSRDDETVVQEIGIYTKPVLGTTSVGAHKKVATIDHTLEWTTITVDLITFFDDGVSSMNAFNVWLNRYCAEGAVVFDDFRLIQKNTYPVEYKLTSISLSGMTTEYIKGDTFVFDGVITAHYSDYSEAYIGLDNSNLTITEPNMSVSGTKEIIVSYTDTGVTKTASYEIIVTSTGNPKDEETLTIVSDADDLAKLSNRRNPETDTYMGCVTVTTETEITYGNSQSAVKLAGPTNEDYCHAAFDLPQAIPAGSITVRFFAKNFSSSNLIVQLRDETEATKAQYSSSVTKGDCTTDQSKSNKFDATDAGNDWILYEHTFYANNVTAGVKQVRFLYRNTLGSSSQYFIIDGLEVFAA